MNIRVKLHKPLAQAAHVFPSSSGSATKGRGRKMKKEREVTNATRFRFLKTNPRAPNRPVIASEKSQ